MSATGQRDGWTGVRGWGRLLCQPSCCGGRPHGDFCSSRVVRLATLAPSSGVGSLGVLRLLAALFAQDDRQRSGGTALVILSHQHSLVEPLLGRGFSFSSAEIGRASCGGRGWMPVG